MASNGGMSIEVDTSQWHDRAAELKQVAPKLLTALRAHLKAAADDGIQAVKDDLSSEAGIPRRAVGTISSSLKATVSFAVKGAGVKITADSKGFSDADKGLLKAFNQPSFRHPLFGNKGQWYNQNGFPYFEKPIMDKLGPDMILHMNAAWDEATAGIKDGI